MKPLVKKVLLGLLVLVNLGLVSAVSYLVYSKSVHISVQDDVTSADRYIFVDVSGAVAKPGVYQLPKTSRVVDAIATAGGLSTSSAALWIRQNMNLAQGLTDAQKLYIPFDWESAQKLERLALAIKSSSTSTLTSVTQGGSSPTATRPTTSSATTPSTEMPSSIAAKININTASIDELDALPGVGEVYAQKLVQFRPYLTAEEIVSKTKISKTTVDKFLAEITF